MVSRELFCTLIEDVIIPQNKFIEEFDKVLGIQICEGHLVKILDAILEGLTDEFELYMNKVTESLIYDWCYNYNFGDVDKPFITIDSVDKYIKSAEQLYDLIMELKNK